jgi:hypothetical protein
MGLTLHRGFESRPLRSGTFRWDATGQPGPIGRCGARVLSKGGISRRVGSVAKDVRPGPYRPSHGGPRTVEVPPHAVPNIPPDLPIPPSAVAPAQSIVVQTRPWDGDGERRDPGSYSVLAIGWYGDEPSPTLPFVFLVFDKMTHDIFWVAQSVVERVVTG